MTERPDDRRPLTLTCKSGWGGSSGKKSRFVYDDEVTHDREGDEAPAEAPLRSPRDEYEERVRGPEYREA